MYMGHHEQHIYMMYLINHAMHVLLNNRHTVVAGIAYTLPTLTLADARIDGNGKIRFQLSR